MFKSIFIALAYVLVSITSVAQGNKNQDIKAIKSMCGCFEVGFNFSETFSFSKDSLYKPSKAKRTKALEWVVLAEETENKLALQHILLAGKNQDYIVKHWRQDWLYENTNLYYYYANNRWTYKRLTIDDVAGQWTQKVFQVDDGPRYEGSASWVHVDGRSYWENTTDAPLPRREYTIRDDYNVTKRRNRHEITPTGWLHDQDNDKIIRSNAGDQLLAQEKGLNTYTKVDDKRCLKAQQYWSKHKDYWKKVRTSWDVVYNAHKSFEIAEKIEGKPLFRHLYTPDETATEQTLRKAILTYIRN